MKLLISIIFPVFESLVVKSKFVWVWIFISFDLELRSIIFAFSSARWIILFFLDLHCHFMFMCFSRAISTTHLEIGLVLLSGFVSSLKARLESVVSVQDDFSGMVRMEM